MKLNFKSDTEVLLSNGTKKTASDITPDDDIDDKFIEKLEKNKYKRKFTTGVCIINI